MGWVSPTGFNDPDTKWGSEADAYNGNTADGADPYSVPPTSWSSFIEFTHAALNCNKIRFYADYDANYYNSMNVEVYYDGAWHDIFEGAYADKDWEEVSIPAGTKSVTAVKFSFYNPSGSTVNPPDMIMEVEFWEVEISIVPVAMNAYRRIREQ